MFADTSTPSARVCGSCGTAATPDRHFCSRCATILPLGRPGDYFAFLGVPRRLSLDGGDLERRYRALSRQFHPDYFGNASPPERRASLERASYLNDAFRTLRSLASRVEYLLSLVERPAAPAAAAATRGPGAVPPGLLEEVFELNEELDAARTMRAEGAPPDVWRSRLDAARRPIEAKQQEHDAQLGRLIQQWDALVDAGVPHDDPRASEIAASLRARMLERNYIANLLATLDREP